MPIARRQCNSSTPNRSPEPFDVRSSVSAGPVLVDAPCVVALRVMSLKPPKYAFALEPPW